MTHVRVLVTGVGGGGVGEQLIKALRMAPRGYSIVGTDVTAGSKGLMEVDVPLVVPRATDPEFVDVLLEIAVTHGVRAVFSGTEADLRVLAAARDRFVAAGVMVPVQPESVLDICLDKVTTGQFLESIGFGTPRQHAVRSLDDVHRVRRFPTVVKPAVGGGGSANIFLAQTVEELEVYALQLLAITDYFVVQEYVGTADDEFTVGVLTDLDGDLLGSIALRRLVSNGLGNRLTIPNRSGRAELGDALVISSGISQGTVGPYREVCEPCERLAAAVGSKGPLNVQCRMVDGVPVVFEVNPRFSGTASIRALMGFNEPDLLVRRHLLGETAPIHVDAREGLVLRGLSEVVVDPTNPAPS
jgi:carbamoyl-phosphate synthase large subunit